MADGEHRVGRRCAEYSGVRGAFSDAAVGSMAGSCAGRRVYGAAKQRAGCKIIKRDPQIFAKRKCTGKLPVLLFFEIGKQLPGLAGGGGGGVVFDDFFEALAG